MSNFAERTTRQSSRANIVKGNELINRCTSKSVNLKTFIDNVIVNI